MKYGRCWNTIRPLFSEGQIRLKIKRSENTKKSEIQKRDIGKLNKKEVKEEFIKKVKQMYKILSYKECKI